jgi:hypothetical protein
MLRRILTDRFLRLRQQQRRSILQRLSIFPVLVSTFKHDAQHPRLVNAYVSVSSKTPLRNRASYTKGGETCCSKQTGWNDPPSASTPTTTTSLRSLIPLDAAELDQLLALGSPTAAQYSAYFGRTSQERYARLVESAIVGFLGVFFSYFLSFVLGGWVATVCGTLFLFWGILSPEFKARQRNWEFLGGRPLVDPPDLWEDDDGESFMAGWPKPRSLSHQGLFGALFVGVVEDVCVVQNADDVLEYGMDEFADYRMERDELERFTGVPWLLRVKCVDSTSRRLQVHARLSEEYLDIRTGAGVLGILLSKSPDFTTLAAITDLYCPSAECWIGDYPYLDRAETELLLAENDNVWDSFALEEAAALAARDLQDDPLPAEEEYRTLT